MRTLSTGLTAAQAAPTINANYKAVINSVTYDESRILHLLHTEETDGATATIILDNSDGTLDALNVKGLQADISYGVDAEYSQCAPVWVIEQHEDTYAGRKVLALICEGIVNWIIRDEASAEFQPEPADTTTVRTYLQHILSSAVAGTTQLPAWAASTSYGTTAYVVPGAGNGWYYKCSSTGISGSAEPAWPLGLKTTVADSAAEWTAWGRAATIYSHAPNYSLTLDSSEALLTSFSPGNAFYVHYRDSRWLAAGKLLSFVESVILPENDGNLHLKQPVVSGTAYDYTYDNSGGTTHSFWKKECSQRLIAPNYVTVESMPDDSDTFTVTASNTADNSLKNVRTFYESYLASSAIASSAATAVITKYQMGTDKGRILAPMNVGQEVYDYVQVIDASGSTVTGNVSSIMRRSAPGVFDMELRLGARGNARVVPMLPPSVEEKSSIGVFMPWFSRTFIPRLNEILESHVAEIKHNTTRLDSHALLTTKAHGGQAALVVTKPADQSLVSSTALQDDTNLVLPVAASATFGFQLHLMTNAPNTPDIKMGWSVPTNATMAWLFVGKLIDNSDGVSAALSATSVQRSGGGLSTDDSHILSGVVSTAGTAGNLQFRWAQDTASTATIKVLKGSYLLAYKLNI